MPSIPFWLKCHIRVSPSSFQAGKSIKPSIKMQCLSVWFAVSWVSPPQLLGFLYSFCRCFDLWLLLWILPAEKASPWHWARIKNKFYCLAGVTSHLINVEIFSFFFLKYCLNLEVWVFTPFPFFSLLLSCLRKSSLSCLVLVGNILHPLTFVFFFFFVLHQIGGF